MRPLADLDPRGVRVLLFDVDDTLTTQGKLTAEAYGALEALRRAGLRSVAVSGRAAGFCEYAARMWPVDAVVGENGGFWFRSIGGKVAREYREAVDVRARNRERYAAISRAIIAAVPGCASASDERYRETDFTIDYAEEVPTLPLEAVERIAGLMRHESLHVAVSSIHIHGWFGDYDKQITSRALLARHFDLDPGANPAAAVFVGDSPNDASMFAAFPKCVGVANVRTYAGRMTAEPRYVTQAAFGAGFAELVAHLLRS
jgi:HAD superfamily hydrolase (TIGR01484 family)